MNPEPQVVPRSSRAAFALIGVTAWFFTQSLLASRGFPEGIVDGVHILLSPLTKWLADHSLVTNLLLIVTSGVIDTFGCFLLFSGIVGPTVRPLLGLMLLFALRQLCQALIALPAPPQMIWHNPGIPSLLVTYDTGNDFFFSGHTAIAVYGAIELSRYQRPWLKVIALVMATIETLTVLVLRAHYTMDVLTAILAAIWVSSLAARLAPFYDRILTDGFKLRPTVTHWRKRWIPWLYQYGVGGLFFFATLWTAFLRENRMKDASEISLLSVRDWSGGALSCWPAPLSHGKTRSAQAIERGN